jgi:SAM-dependent methyltransferase
MNVAPESHSARLRAELEDLSWPDRFDRLKVEAKRIATDDQRVALAQLRAEFADLALVELSAQWDGLPLKEGILRLPSKQMRGALTRAAKNARDRRIADVMSKGGAPLDGKMDWSHRFAIGLDERAIEMPLALRIARLHDPGEVLDAGAALNVPVVRQVVGRPTARLTHFTLPGVNEPVLAGDEDRFTYAFGDLRAMPYPDASFDRIVCVSTLEHVGMDNARYGVSSEDDAGSARSALSELIRVLVPNGELFVTVPYGRAAHHGWFRIFDLHALHDLLAAASAEQVELRFFYYHAGWAEDGPAPPSRVVDAAFLPDVITGVALARIVKKGLEFDR